MEQAASLNPEVRLNDWHLDPKRDQRRNESLVRMRIKNRNTRALGVLQTTVGPGEHTINVYKDEVHKVEAMVEREPHLIAEAEKQYNLEMAELVMKVTSGFQGTAEDMWRIIQSKSSEEVDREYRRLLRTSPLSVQGVFRSKYKRDIKPLESAELIPNSEFAEPQRQELDREVSRQAGMFAAALDGAVDRVITALGGKSAVPDPAALERLIADRVAAEVSKLLGEKTQPKK